MPVLVTKEAPDFTADAVFPGGTMDSFSLSSWKGKYVILLFYPMDFSYVCPSEIIAFNKRTEDFQKRHFSYLTAFRKHCKNPIAEI